MTIDNGHLTVHGEGLESELGASRRKRVDDAGDVVADEEETGMR